MGVCVWRGKSTTVLPLIDVLTWHQQPTVLSECCFPQSSRRDGFHCETGTDSVALWHIITLQWGLQLDSTSIPSSFVLFLHILAWIKRYIHLKKSFYPFASDNDNSVLNRNVLPLRCQFNKTANLQLHQHKRMSVNKYETHVCRTASNTSLSYCHSGKIKPGTDSFNAMTSMSVFFAVLHFQQMQPNKTAVCKCHWWSSKRLNLCCETTTAAVCLWVSSGQEVSTC